jgi:hypothetical protein
LSPACRLPFNRQRFHSLANDILGYVVQIVSGKTFGAFLQERDDPWA